jgi:hypothetical protein
MGLESKTDEALLSVLLTTYWAGRMICSRFQSEFLAQKLQ